jgi:hypothetical protein
LIAIVSVILAAPSYLETFVSTNYVLYRWIARIYQHLHRMVQFV